MNEPVEHNIMWTAYKHWHKFCDDNFGGAGLEQSPLFEAFIQHHFSWYEMVIWCPPEVARTVHLLASPHYYSLLKAYYARLDETSVEVS